MSEDKHGYPRPQLERSDWVNLNGLWDFALDPEAEWAIPPQVNWDSQILVPFAPETEASGIGNTGFYKACWYRRTFQTPDVGSRRLILHFGAVDHAARVWVNGQFATEHEGGYTPFSVDITEYLLFHVPRLPVREASASYGCPATESQFSHSRCSRSSVFFSARTLAPRRSNAIQPGFTLRPPSHPAAFTKGPMGRRVWIIVFAFNPTYLSHFYRTLDLRGWNEALATPFTRLHTRYWRMSSAVDPSRAWARRL